MYQILFAGFGGQGILASGIILANAGMNEGKHVSWLPAYGAEQRGGTANCTVMISDEEIGTPFYEELDILVAMNEPSFDMFETFVKPDGVIIANSSLIPQEKYKGDSRVVGVDSYKIAAELGNAKVSNIVILGNLVRNLPIVSDNSMHKAIGDFFSDKGDKVIDLNIRAYNEGHEKAV